MNVKELFTDDRAVSPVIGVILMVAITVILAAVIGTFVLGLGNNLSATAPNANFQFDYSAGNNPTTVKAIHQGGTTITEDNAKSLELVAESSYDTVDPFALPVKSGSSATIDNVADGTTVRVIWTSTDGGTSQTLAEGQTPS